MSVFVTNYYFYFCRKNVITFTWILALKQSSLWEVHDKHKFEIDRRIQSGFSLKTEATSWTGKNVVVKYSGRVPRMHMYAGLGRVLLLALPSSRSQHDFYFCQIYYSSMRVFVDYMNTNTFIATIYTRVECFCFQQTI